MLEIKDLHVSAASGPILKGLNLEIGPGEVHAIMGPNGSGKSTLAAAIMGNPEYEVARGSMRFLNLDLASMKTEERAAAGIFLGFQTPVEIPGLSYNAFLKHALNASRKAAGLPELSAPEFLKAVLPKSRALGIDDSMLKRAVNAGFSGGEKKRLETLQMAVLEPRLCVVDELDAGLDIDALKVVAEGVAGLRSPDRSFLFITHRDHLLRHVAPDFIHILMDGRIVRSGGRELAERLEAKGYDGIAG